MNAPAPKIEADTTTPEQLATLINREYSTIIKEEQTSNHNIVERAIKVGEQLSYCKTKVGHGNWEKWVKTNIPQIHPKKVERWMNLAKNKEKIEAKNKELNSKNDTVSFLTLRQALAIANNSGSGRNSSDNYDGVEKRLLKKLEPMNYDDADAAVKETITKLKAVVAQKKAA
jgi:hypothetical protein